MEACGASMGFDPEDPYNACLAMGYNIGIWEANEPCFSAADPSRIPWQSLWISMLTLSSMVLVITGLC
jgi:hypothetical protein